MEILAALIAGFFTLAGIWLRHYLTNQTEAPKQETIKKRKSRRGKGLFIFVVNIFAFLYIVLEAFNNSELPGTWTLLFLLFSLSVIPIYSIYLMIKG
ncbi:hypothetical protein [Candidatus Marithrix sp. Canyon 246]|uniref:hypothetical protein n=1 Tax=Candidatus Marithrix sp. Canyon 246 TaxID=1827136 RepID=UPI00084A2B1E|nr:hypothetical protein [Candidatus Marithrix sp. Canyon 246]